MVDMKSKWLFKNKSQMEKACLCYKKDNIPEEMALLSVAWLLSLWLHSTVQSFRDSSELKLSTWGRFSDSIRPLTWLFLISSTSNWVLSSFNSESDAAVKFVPIECSLVLMICYLASLNMWLLQMVHLKFKQVIFLNSNSHLKSREETIKVEHMQIVKWSTISS